MVLSVEGCKLLTDAAITPLQAPEGADGGSSGGSVDTEGTAPAGRRPRNLCRLNLSWVDGVSNAALQAALLASRDHDHELVDALQILDYYGTCWGLVGASGRPARTVLRDTAAVPRSRLKGWLAAYDSVNAAADDD